MIRLRNISKVFAGIVCILSLLGVYLIQTVCFTEDFILTREQYSIERHNHTGDEGQNQKHHNHSESHGDDCCSSETGNYFASFQATVPISTKPPITTNVLPFEAIGQIFYSYYNNSNNIPENESEGPPLPYDSGAGKRILIQSFQI